MKRVWLLLVTLWWSSPSVAQQYQVGQHVEAYSPMAGRWVAGTIARLDGSRYMFQADDHSLANDYWGVTPDQLRPVGAGTDAPGLAGQTPQPAPRGTEAAGRPDPAPTPQAQAPAGNCGSAGGAHGTVRMTGARPAPLGGGIFPNGTPLGTPGQTNYMNNRNGQRSIVAVAPPGLGSPIGRFNLMVGGTWSTATIRDLGGGVTERTLEWNVPAQANVLLINPDHSWFRKSGSTRLSGRWIDLGQNVVQLIGYDGDDWTGSIQRWNDGICRMEMRGPLGQNEWGRPF
jgi:hypothetical protein